MSVVVCCLNDMLYNLEYMCKEPFVSNLYVNMNVKKRMRIYIVYAYIYVLYVCLNVDYFPLTHRWYYVQLQPSFTLQT